MVHGDRPPRVAVIALRVWLVFAIAQVVAVPMQERRGSCAGGATLGWRALEQVRPAELVHVRVAVSAGRTALDELASAVLAVSDPTSVRYGQHLSLAEVQLLVAPPQEAVQLVVAWLAGSGVVSSQLSFSSNRDLVSVILPAAKVETLLGVPLYYFQPCHAPAVGTIVRPLEPPKLPAELLEAVDFISPGFRFPLVGRRRQGDMKRLRGKAPTPTQEGV